MKHPYSGGFSINALMSETFHTEILGPNFVCRGYRPDLTPAHQVLLETGMMAGMGGSAFASPIIRGAILLQKALEICNELKTLGSALLSAMEKKDAEHFSLLCHQHETRLLTLVQDAKFMQWKESESSTEALLKSRNTVFERYKHYKVILGNSDADIEKSRSLELARTQLKEDGFDVAYADWVGKYGQDIAKEAYRQENTMGGLMEFAGSVVTDIFNGQLGKTLPLNKNENAELNIYLPTADTFNTAASVLRLLAPILALIPQFDVQGTPLGVGGVVTFGGEQLSKAAKGGAEVSKEIANAFTSSAERASKLASYYRRAEDYVLQANLAACELQSYGRQIISSLIREQLHKKEYDNHKIQIENAQELEAFLSDKFTNEDLYSWMKGELSKTYFDCYKFAFDIAKRAEATLKQELMRKEFDDLNLIKFGYWDSAREGLLAGDALHLDLQRLEMAYHDMNLREYEIMRHVSLVRLDPVALLKLKATGACEVAVPEWLYDMDSPGQYMRRIKNMAISIPCIVGPYTGVHCKVSLLKSSIRTSSLLGDDYARSTTGDDNRFRDFSGAIQSIVTSTAQNDSGLFDPNLKDERYLPFEGAGAISTWRIELPNDIPQFDFETISDLILHIRYTAREAGHLKADAVTCVRENVLQASNALLQLFCISNDFSSAWQAFTSAANDNVRKLEISLDADRFPYWTKPLGMDDNLVATFSAIDWKKNKLTLATKTVTLAGDYAGGWTLSIDKTVDVFPFLKKNMSGKVYMTLSYSIRT
jgi:hypothetical protein